MSIILGKAHFPEREKHTKVEFVTMDNVIQLPNEYYITEIELNRIRGTFGVGKVEEL